MTKKLKRPNPRTQLFVRELLAHPEKTQAQAYMVAHPNVTKLTATVHGSNTLAKPHVQAHINEVLDQMYPELAKSAAAVLMETLNNPEIAISMKLKVIEMLAKFKGWNAATKIDKREVKVDLTKFRLPGSE